MEPTEAELPGLCTAGPLLDWVGVRDGSDLAGEFHAAFGSDRNALSGILARMPQFDYESITATITINQAPLTPVQASQLALVWETARLATGVAKLAIVKDREVAAKDAADRATAQAAAQAAPHLPVASASRKTVSAELTVDQTDRKTEYAKLSATDVAAAYEEYHLRMGGKAGAVKRVLPMPDREPTIDQLSALAAIRDEKEVVYVDLAVWTPFAGRARRKRTFSGYTLGTDGELHLAELKGPATHSDWEASFEIFKTACVMLKIAVLETLIRYQALIKKYHTAYGSACWALLYQAECRMRLEQFERILRKGELQHAMAQQPGGQPTDFDPAMPWEWVFQQAVEAEGTFWTDEFERTAVLVRTREDRMADHIGSDANVDSGNARSRGQGGGSAARAPSSAGERGLGRSRRARPSKVHNTVGEKFITNRAGKDLCRNYQTGECKDTVKGSGGGPVCGRNPELVHQCELCLGNHPAAPADGKPCPVGSTAHREPKSVERGKANKGKGKGKGGKSGKYGGQWQR